MGQYGPITSVEELPKDEVILEQVKEAARLNSAGVKMPRPKPRSKPPLKIPTYFTLALQGNPKAFSTFQSFSSSHQREYVEWVTEAKTEPTRQKRLATTLEWLAEGKSRNWKYEKC